MKSQSHQKEMVALCLWSVCHKQANKRNNTQNSKRQRQKLLPNQIEHRIDKYFTTWYCLLPFIFLYSMMFVHIYKYKTKTIFVMFFRFIFISHHLFDSNLKTYGFDLFRRMFVRAIILQYGYFILFRSTHFRNKNTRLFWKRFNYLSRMYHLRLKISSQNEHMDLFS